MAGRRSFHFHGSGLSGGLRATCGGPMPWCPGARVYRLAAINRYHGDGKHTTHLVWIIYGTWYPFMNILVGVVCIYIYIYYDYNI